MLGSVLLRPSVRTIGAFRSSLASLASLEQTAASRHLRTFTSSSASTSSLFSASVSSSSADLSLPSTLVAAPRRGMAGPAVVGGKAGEVVPFPLADIGEGIAECEVLKWFIKEGDAIKQFDKVCEVQSDKANVEITSRFDGIVDKLMYKVGEMAAVGKPLFMIKLTADAGGAGSKAGAGGNSATAATAATAVAAPAAPSCPASSSSSFSAARSPAPARVAKQLRSANEVLASPVVRRLAIELGVDLTFVPATGTKGQITKEDVHSFLADGQQTAPSASVAPVATPAFAAAPVAAAAPAAHGHAAPGHGHGKPVLPIPSTARGNVAPADVTVAVTGIQRVMVKTMTAAAAIPTFGFADEILVDNLVRFRKRVQPVAERHGVKLSYFAFVVKALSLALTKYPQLNAHVNADCTAVVQKGSHNIGLAMDTPRGLLVPNIKNVQALSVLEIGAELARLQALGKVRSLRSLRFCSSLSLLPDSVRHVLRLD